MTKITAHHQIFAQAAVDNADPVADLRRLIGVSVKAVDVEYASYAAVTDTTSFDVAFGHEFDDDADLPFSQYPIVITVRDLGRDLDRQERVARQVFAGLRGLHAYRLMLVFDLQHRLDIAEPETAAGFSPPREPLS